jgi:hypothetical protein
VIPNYVVPASGSLGAIRFQSRLSIAQSRLSGKEIRLMVAPGVSSCTAEAAPTASAVTISVIGSIRLTLSNQAYDIPVRQ